MAPWDRSLTAPASDVACGGQDLTSHEKSDAPQAWSHQTVRRQAGVASVGPACLTVGRRHSGGGEGGIRTHEPLAGLHAFQACLIGLSSTSPWYRVYRFTG